eukprot:6197760-Pleurochrysis_carterae.AAC.5
MLRPYYKDYSDVSELLSRPRQSCLHECIEQVKNTLRVDDATTEILSRSRIPSRPPKSFPRNPQPDRRFDATAWTSLAKEAPTLPARPAGLLASIASIDVQPPLLHRGKTRTYPCCLRRL